jgi:hypothetical protein
MNIASYDDLLHAARAQAQPQRLLFAFALAELPPDADAAERERFKNGQGGALKPVMCADKTAPELGSFGELVEESMHMGSDWDVVFVSTLSGRDGKLPASTEADAPLNMMVAAIHTGEVSRFLAFNREGELLRFA